MANFLIRDKEFSSDISWNNYLYKTFTPKEIMVTNDPTIYLEAGRILYPGDISDPNAFFVRRRWAGRHPFDFFDFDVGIDYALYVPERFILGDFVKSKGKMVPDEIARGELGSRMYLTKLSEDLSEMERNIDRGKLIKKVSLLLPEGVIEGIQNSWAKKEYTRDRFFERASSVGNYIPQRGQ